MTSSTVVLPAKNILDPSLQEPEAPDTWLPVEEGVNEARTSILDIIVEFEGESVKPSQVRSSSSKLVKNGSSKSNVNAEKKVDEVDLKAVHALLSALSFIEYTNDTSTECKSNASKPAPTKFVFDTPLKGNTSSNTNNSNEITIAPWAAKRQPVQTPSTVGTVSSEDEGLFTPSPKKPSCDNHDEKNQPNDNDEVKTNSPHRPVQSFQLAYPLSLPKEIMQPETNDNNDKAALADKFRRNIIEGKNKLVKKFPTVSTDIPGAGTRRSSTSSLKKATPKMPFVHMVHSASAVNNNTTALERYNANKNKKAANIALNVFRTARNVWMGARTTMPPITAATETIVSTVAGIATGNGNLQDMEDNLLVPLVGALDQHILNPIVGMVGGFLSGVFGMGGGANRDQGQETNDGNTSEVSPA